MASIPSVTTIIVLANSVSVNEVNEFKKKFPKLKVHLLTEVEEIGKSKKLKLFKTIIHFKLAFIQQKPKKVTLASRHRRETISL